MKGHLLYKDQYFYASITFIWMFSIFSFCDGSSSSGHFKWPLDRKTSDFKRFWFINAAERGDEKSLQRTSQADLT